MSLLQTNTRLTHLDLSNNHLGYDGGRELTTVLLANNFITHIVSGRGLVVRIRDLRAVSRRFKY